MSFFRSNKRDQNQSSKFWLDIDSLNGSYDVLTGITKKGPDLVKLVSIRRSIANFVRIVTGKEIPVVYSSGQQSYTNGKQVIISAKIEGDDFDPTVGLALHEASHCLLTDFGIFPRLISSPPMDLIKRVIAERKLDMVSAKEYVLKNLKELINIIEDRRIDNYIFTNAPGYKGYYHALYDKYFNDPMIDKGLVSGSFRDESWESYLFRIGNMTNKNRDLNALKGLKQIWDLIDIKNIGRYTDTKEIEILSYKIFGIIEDNITDAPQQQQQQDKGKSGGSGKGQPKPKDEKTDDLPNMDPANKGPKDKAEESDDKGDNQGDSESPAGEEDKDADEDSKGKADDKVEELPPLSDKELKDIAEAIKKQKDFLDGDIKKVKLNDQDQQKLEAIVKADADYANVAKDMAHNKIEGCRVLVGKKFTKQLINSGVFAHTCKKASNSSHRDAVVAGLKMGAILGKKLQIRQEARDTKFTRQNVGKIDRRLIASIGTGLENVFEQTFVTKYNPSIIHITIDASGSMAGVRFQNSLKCAVAMAKACSMIENLDCVISFRATETSAGQEIPSILIGYDSRVDSINKIINLFPHLSCDSSTPEGLCFEAILKLIPAGGKALNSYFINFSDGEPGFSNNQIQYSGAGAIEHTKKMCQKIREKNVKILSYFIGNTNRRNTDFQRMYGKDAQFLDVNSVPLVARSMNDKFLQTA